MTDDRLIPDDVGYEFTVDQSTGRCNLPIADKRHWEWSENRSGVRTYYVYDVTGNTIETRTQAQDEAGGAGWLVTRTLFDSQGRAEFTTDSYFVLDADYPTNADVAVSGNRNVYDQFGRVVRTELHYAITLSLVSDPNHTGQQTTALPSSFDWETNGSSTQVSQDETYYDDLGRVEYTVENGGLRTEYTYDAANRQIETRYQAKDADGNLQWVVSRTVYNSLGQAIVTSDAYVEQSDGTMPPTSGTKTSYDQLGRTVKTERVEGLLIDLTDPSQGPVWSAVSVRWLTENVYNNLGQLIRAIGMHVPGEEGPVTEFVYDEQGRQIAELHPAVLDQTTGELVRHRVETHFSDSGSVDYTKENVRVVVDAAGEVLSTDYSNARQTSYQYDAHGRVIRTTYADGSFSAKTYDTDGRLWKEGSTTAAGGTSSEKAYEYDDWGRLIRVTLPEVQNPVTGQLVQPVYEYTYDAHGNQTLIRDPLGRETRFTYDERGRLLSRTLPLGHGEDGILGTADDAVLSGGEFTEQFEYDEQGRQVLAISFEGIVTRAVYDADTGQLVRKEFFGSELLYDDGNGSPQEVWTYFYDALGRAVEVIRDDDGNVVTTTDQRATRNTYADDGRLTVVENAEGILVYVYDALGRKASTAVYSATADPATATPERVVSYAYDELGRLASVEEDLDPTSSSDSPLVASYRYDLPGNLQQTHLPNGVIEDYLYDELGRLDLLTHYAPDATPNDLSDNARLVEFDYAVRADGKRTAVTETHWLDTDSDGIPEEKETQIDWAYDGLGRLVSESIDHFDAAFDRAEYFAYDLVGNRLSRQLDKNLDSTIDEVITYLYDANDRLISEARDSDNDGIVDETTVYEFDGPLPGSGDGTQVTSKTVIDTSTSQTVSQVAYTYDLQGRLLTATVTSHTAGSASRVEKTTYDYDASGIRVSALHQIDNDADGTWDEVKRTEYLGDHDNFTGYQQVVKETVFGESGNIGKVIEYQFGHDEITQTVTEYDGSGGVTSEGTLVFGHDGHGSVRILYVLGNTTDPISQVFTFSAYGEMIALHGADGMAVPTVAALTSLRYSGEYFDDKVQQHYLRARWYDQRNGRFSRLDPFVGNAQDPLSLHKYTYAHGDPVGMVDPTGLFGIGAVGIAMAIGGPPGIGDSILGALESLVTTYAINLEWDVAWASDWDLADNLHSRSDNSWVTAAILAGAVEPWLEWFEGLDYSGGFGGNASNGNAFAMAARPGGRPGRSGINGPRIGNRLGASVKFRIGSTELRAVSLGKSKGYVYHSPNLGKPIHFRGDLRAPVDGRLVARAKALRERMNLTGHHDLKNKNVAVASVEVNGKEGFIEKVSADRIHSEELIAIRVRELRNQGHRVEVKQLFTERIPCVEQQCRPLIAAEMPDAKVSYYTTRRGSNAARDLADAYRI